MKLIRHLLVASIFAANIAGAAVAYVNSNLPNGAIPLIFQAGPPAGDQVYALLFTNGTGSGTFTLTGAITTMTNNAVVGASPCASGCNNFSDGHGDTYSLWSSLSATAPPTVASTSQNTSTGIWTTGTQAFQAGQVITLTGTPPTGFATGTNYIILGTGLDATHMELSTDGVTLITPSTSSACTVNTIFQNFSVSQPTGNSLLSSWEIEFSGGVATKSPLYTTTASPGGGTGAVPGQAVTVATGDALVVIAYDTDAFGDAPTVNAGAWSPTTIQASNSSIAVYIMGTGASITPSFNAATGDLTTPHQVIQWVVSQTAIVSTSYGPVQPKFTPFMTGANDDLYSPWPIRASRRRFMMSAANEDLYDPWSLQESRRFASLR